LPSLRADLWFGRLPPALSARLLEVAELRQLHDKQPLFRRGDACSGLYGLLSGAMRVSGLTEAGKEAILTMLQPLSWFGEIGLFDGMPRTHDVVAEGPVTVLHLPQFELMTIVGDNPLYWRELGLLMALKLRLAFIGMEDMALLPAEARMARRLVFLAHAGAEPRDVASHHIGVNQEQLALMLALSRQTANKILKSFEQEGAVRVAYGRIEVLDLSRLKQLGGVSEREDALTRARPGLL
jgi:CRP-like cAMP-binding protein